MIRKLPSGEYRLYSKKKDPRTGKRRNLGTFKTRAAAEKHERAVQYFNEHIDHCGRLADSDNRLMNRAPPSLRHQFRPHADAAQAMIDPKLGELFLRSVL